VADSEIVRPPDAPRARAVVEVLTEVVGAPVVLGEPPLVVPVVQALQAVTRTSTASEPRPRTVSGYVALADARLDTGPVPTRLVAATS
jgi:hypothetical protein